MTRGKWATIEQARDILHLGDDATLAEIKRAYHRLSKRYHPDSAQGKGQGNTDKMYQLTAAYEQLMQYCAEYRFPLTPSGKEELDQCDPEDWWQERFGEDPLWGKGDRRRK